MSSPTTRQLDNPLGITGLASAAATEQRGASSGSKLNNLAKSNGPMTSCSRANSHGDNTHPLHRGEGPRRPFTAGCSRFGITDGPRLRSLSVAADLPSRPSVAAGKTRICSIDDLPPFLYQSELEVAGLGLAAHFPRLGQSQLALLHLYEVVGR
jgi:hypothetical protein